MKKVIFSLVILAGMVGTGWAEKAKSHGELVSDVKARLSMIAKMQDEILSLVSGGSNVIVITLTNSVQVKVFVTNLVTVTNVVTVQQTSPAVDPKKPSTISDVELQEILKNVSGLSGPKRIGYIKSTFPGKKFSVGQVVQILNAIAAEDERFSALQMASPGIVDPENKNLLLKQGNWAKFAPMAVKHLDTIK